MCVYLVMYHHVQDDEEAQHHKGPQSCPFKIINNSPHTPIFLTYGCPPFLTIVISKMLCKWNKRLCSLWVLAVFPWRDSLVIYPNGCSLNGWFVFTEDLHSLVGMC